jgi:hypothetical protein
MSEILCDNVLLVVTSSAVVVILAMTSFFGDVASISHTSHLTPHTSHLTPHTSHLTPHTSHLTPHTSHPTPHTSHLTPHTSHLTPHTSQIRRIHSDAATVEKAFFSCAEAISSNGIASAVPLALDAYAKGVFHYTKPLL